MTKAQQNSEAAILAALTALVYTFQLIYGIGTVISYLSVIPLVYGMSRSRSEWLKMAIVSSVMVFLMNDIAGSLFFVLFIVPMSVSVMMRTSGISIFLAESPLLWSLIIVLSKFGWIVGFEIPPLFDGWWIVLVLLFLAFVVEGFSRITKMALRSFGFHPRIKNWGFEPALIITVIDSVFIFVFYGLSEQSLLNFGVVLPLMMVEPLKLSVVEMEKIAMRTLHLLHRRSR